LPLRPRTDFEGLRGAPITVVAGTYIQKRKSPARCPGLRQFLGRGTQYKLRGQTVFCPVRQVPRMNLQGSDFADLSRASVSDSLNSTGSAALLCHLARSSRRFPLGAKRHATRAIHNGAPTTIAATSTRKHIVLRLMSRRLAGGSCQPSEMLGNWAQQAQHVNEQLMLQFEGNTVGISVVYGWLGNLDSNQDKQSQSLLCYRYTIPHRSA
jgi:hypothetical protein